MRRLNLVLIPAVLFITAASAAGAQTRRAPSIGDVVRRVPGRVITQQGVSTRGVYLPQQQECSNGNNGYGYDGRYDRNSRMDQKQDRKDRKQDRKEMRKDRRQDDGDADDQYGNNDGYGCCADRTHNQNGTYNQGGYDQNGRYDQYGRRDPNGQYDQYGRVLGSRNSGTGTIYSNGNGVYTGNGRVNPNGNGRVNGTSNGCSPDRRPNQNHRNQGHRDNDDNDDHDDHGRGRSRGH